MLSTDEQKTPFPTQLVVCCCCSPLVIDHPCHKADEQCKVSPVSHLTALRRAHDPSRGGGWYGFMSHTMQQSRHRQPRPRGVAETGRGNILLVGHLADLDPSLWRLSRCRVWRLRGDVTGGSFSTHGPALLTPVQPSNGSTLFNAQTQGASQMCFNLNGSSARFHCPFQRVGDSTETW